MAEKAARRYIHHLVLGAMLIRLHYDGSLRLKGCTHRACSALPLLILDRRIESAQLRAHIETDDLSSSQVTADEDRG